MDDAEPTRDADADPTAKVPAEDETTLSETSVAETPELAWSASDGADTALAMAPHRRSWQIPTALAALALVGLGTVAVIRQDHPRMEWRPNDAAPANSAPASQAVGPAASTVPSNGLTLAPVDEAFVDSLNAHGFNVHGNDVPHAVAAGRRICARLEEGVPKSDMIEVVHLQAPSLTPVDVQTLIDDASIAYCPQYR